MWFHNLYQSVVMRFERFDAYQIVVLMMVIVAVGFICLRGYGSRSNY